MHSGMAVKGEPLKQHLIFSHMDFLLVKFFYFVNRKRKKTRKPIPTHCPTHFTIQHPIHFTTHYPTHFTIHYPSSFHLLHFTISLHSFTTSPLFRCGSRRCDEGITFSDSQWV